MTGATTHTAPALRRGPLLAGAAALMVVPVLALRLANPVPGDPGDYMFLLILLTGLGLALEVALRTPPRRAYAMATGLAVAAGLFQAWINLAVGVVGTEDNAFNLIYAAVILIALGGAALARLRPAGMARAMIAAAIAQALTFFIALVTGLGFTGPITVFFTALWLLSARLYRQAADAG